MKSAELEAGTVIHTSLGKSLLPAAFAAVVCFAGLGMLVASLFLVGNSLGLAGLKPAPANRLPNLLLGLFFAALGGGLGLLGGLLLIGNIMDLVYKVRFVIGKKCLQSVLGEEKVITQIPYDNIRAVRLGSRRMRNQTIQYIGIDLEDPDREDTMVSGSLKHGRAYGCDAVILDNYDIPLEDFYRKLRARWKKTAGEP